MDLRPKLNLNPGRPILINEEYISFNGPYADKLSLLVFLCKLGIKSARPKFMNPGMAQMFDRLVTESWVYMGKINTDTVRFRSR